MLKHKTIAVCVTGYNKNNEMKAVKGIKDKCREYGYNTLEFVNTIIKPELNSNIVIDKNVVNGEMQVFKLMNYDLIDAVIIFGDSFLDSDVFSRIVKTAKERGIPLIDIDDEMHTGVNKVTLSNRYAMESVIRHLIEHHGLTDIAFINGFRNNVQSDERLSAYKKILTEHNIPIREDMIYYGEFWTKSKECTEEIIRKGRLPQAIACANDTMACFCMDVLKSHNIRIPEDIIVTGFDGLVSGSEYTPSVTSVRRALYTAGATAVDLLKKFFEGEELPEETFVESEFVEGQSCGCVTEEYKVDIPYERRFEVVHGYKQFNKYVLDMNIEFSHIKDHNDLFTPLYFGAKLLGIDTLYICIDSRIANGQDILDVDKEPLDEWGVPQKMKSMLVLGHNVPVGFGFDTCDLIPGGLHDEEECFDYMFLSLYFKNNFLGYMAFIPPEDYMESDFLSTWIVAINNNAGGFYLNYDLTVALEELQRLYLRDMLTGFFNRRGLNKYERSFISSALKKEKVIAVVCADVDNLKKVNDSFGHEEGDNAIVTSANAMKEAFPDDSILVRTGGDEFLIYAAFDGSGEVDAVIGNVDRILDEYNRTSGKPYKAGCSCGYTLIRPGDEYVLDDIKNAADDNMYEVKRRKKAVRSD